MNLIIITILRIISIVFPIGFICYVIGNYIEYDKQIHDGFVGILGRVLSFIGNVLLIPCGLSVLFIVIFWIYWAIWS